MPKKAESLFHETNGLGTVNQCSGYTLYDYYCDWQREYQRKKADSYNQKRKNEKHLFTPNPAWKVAFGGR